MFLNHQKPPPKKRRITERGILAQPQPLFLFCSDIKYKPAQDLLRISYYLLLVIASSPYSQTSEDSQVYCSLDIPQVFNDWQKSWILKQEI